jgi:hypothetical protein
MLVQAGNAGVLVTCSLQLVAGAGVYLSPVTSLVTECAGVLVVCITTCYVCVRRDVCVMFHVEHT